MLERLTLWVSICLLAVIVLTGCGRSASNRIADAARVVEQRPDSALVILSQVSYADVNDDEELMARFALVRGLANNRLDKSLVTDTLLPYAVRYYSGINDTLRWALSSRMLAQHYYATGRTGEAVECVDRLLDNIDSQDLCWDIHINRAQLAFIERDYETAARDARWLVDHTSLPEDQLRYSDMLMVSLSFSGRHSEALAVGDSVIHSDFMPQKYSVLWGDFMNDYAYMLQGAGRQADAVAAMEDMMANTPLPFPEEALSRNLSMAEFQLNAGNIAKASHYLSLIDDDSISPYAEAYIKKALMLSVIEYNQNGRIPATVMQDIPKHMDMALRMAVNGRETAIENVYLLDRDKAAMTIERQRMWIVILSLVAVLVLVTSAAVYLIYRRKERLAAAEEKAETLAEMLASVRNDSREESKDVMLRKLVLQQLGILKTFAGAPTAQNQDALRKISALASGDADSGSLVDWGSLYQLVDELYDGFHSHLTREFPGLFSEKEIQIIVLIKAGFSTKEIGVLTEQSSATIYVRKTAIRKKLNTPANGDFMLQIEGKTAS